ncbi:ABC transporter permease [Catalinimonas niigatensis]|uniref:ABC transporter permease n=1 Tax=Catalinimonas niigatensis TaxID=1397264 RepID=UPI0026667612|nr:ABC transporter permease [Catalinimonas niigatensis]WPP48830.1 ABC transporter permease [Catalinimonas niigatensis]
MLDNYFKIALRNLWKRKFFTAINIIGLAVGMTCCLLISVYVLDELSYDSIHEKADRIYRITTYLNINGQEYDVASSSEEVAEVLSTELPEAEKLVRIDPLNARPVKYGEQLFSEENILAVDSTFFDVFSFPLAEGNLAKALQHPQSVILTQTTASKYFGRQSDLLGETLLIDRQAYTITGIAEDPPANSHFHFDFLIPFQYQQAQYPGWVNVDELKTYMLLTEGSDPTPIPEKLYALFKKHDAGQYEEMTKMGVKADFSIQPLLDIHLYSQLLNEFEPSGDVAYVYAFVAIALFIMLLACTNFINLSTARSAERAKEVGIRKTVGSSRAALVRQFLMESMLMSMLAMLLALGLAELLRYPFNEVAGKTLELHLLDEAQVWGIILSITLLSGLLAGLYPAWYLTKFEPIKVLKGNFISGRQSQRFRNVLVVFQYSVSIVLVICTLLVYQQLRYMQNINLGFNKENVLVIRNADRLQTQYESFFNALRSQSFVKAVAAATQNPLAVDNISDARNKEDNSDQSMMLASQTVTYEYLQTLGIQIKEGRNFSPDMASDTAALILNQAAVRALGLEDPLNALIDYDMDYDYHVIGITEDFHFDSPHKSIVPFAFMLRHKEQKLSTIEVRIASDDMAKHLAEIENLWNSQAADVPFTYSFLDEDYDAMFRAEQRLGKLFTGFTILALLVAGLGLFALAAFMAERRAKEIGIRKVLGATVTQVVLLLGKDFMRLLLLAFLIAIPLGYFSMRQWLENFEYRIEMSVALFIMAGFGVMLIAWLTISFQSVKAATANPVDSLRNE